jgi:CysZ protein
MTFFNEFILGFSSYMKAMDFSKAHKLGNYYFYPALFSALIFCGLGVISYLYIGELTSYLDKLLNKTPIDGIWYKIAQWIVNILVWAFAFLVYLKVYRYLVLIILSPFLGMVAGKVQDILHQHSTAFDIAQLFKDIARGIMLSLRNLVWELLFTAILMLLSIVFPLIAPVTVVLIVVFESYYVGFSMIDYHHEYKKLSASESIRLVKKHRAFAIGNGLIFNLLLFIPVIGVLVAPTLSAIAAGIGMYEIEKSKQFQSK